VHVDRPSESIYSQVVNHAEQEHLAGYKLLQDATLVLFDVTEKQVEPSVENEEMLVRIEMQMKDHDEDDPDDVIEDDDDECNTVEWGALGFIFALAVLSFADARPRGVSDMHFEDGDEFTVADLLARLRYERGELNFNADYLRGRCMKTDVIVRPNGHVTLATRCRGEAPLRWVDRLKGKKPLTPVALEA
jgi:hypothetical protein